MGKGNLFSFGKSRKERGKNETPGQGHDGIDILPPEIWTIILEKVGDFQDRWSCYNACTLWRDILQPTNYTSGFHLILPMLMKYLDVDDILVCRQVCRQWCDSVDEIASNNSQLRPYKTVQDPALPAADFGNMFTGIGASWDLTTVAKAKHLLQETANHPKNPIIGRSFKMNCLKDEEVLTEDKIQEHQDVASDLLRNMGSHVFYYTLVFDASHVIPLTLAQLIRRHMLQLPNVRMLAVNEHLPLFAFERWTNADMQALAMYLRDFGLPRLPKLESLSFTSDTIPFLIEFLLIRGHRHQLKKLEINVSKLTNNLLEHLTVLTELSINVSTNAQNTILPLLQLNAPALQKLSIHASISVCLQAEDILQVCRRFPQLHFLHFVLGPFSYLRDGDCRFPPELDCPSVEIVKFYVRSVPEHWVLENRFSLNFLRCFTRLKKLSLVYQEACPTLAAFARVVDLDRRLGGEVNGSVVGSLDILDLKENLRYGRLYESKIWKVLPRLQTVSSQWLEHPASEQTTVKYFYWRQKLEPKTECERQGAGGVKDKPIPKEKVEKKKKKEGSRRKLSSRIGKAMGNLCIGAASLLL